MLCDPNPAMVSTSSEGTDQGSLKERKRGQNPSEWKIIVAKRKRNSGEMYVSRDTGKVVKQREVGPPCNDGCYARLGDDVVKDIHESFWKIGDYNFITCKIHSFKNTQWLMYYFNICCLYVNVITQILTFGGFRVVLLCIIYILYI